MHDYNEDPFVATRMSLGDHAEELRMRLWGLYEVGILMCRIPNAECRMQNAE